MKLNYVIVNETGMKRTNNEDAVFFSNPAKPWVKQAMGSLAIVADGMGGHAKGEKASKLAVEIISKEFYRKILPPEEALENACLIANNAIAKEGLIINQSIGTTCTAIAITAKDLFLLHIGDSRAYLLKNRKLTQLTKDHTVASEIPDFYRSNNAIKNLLTRSLGVETAQVCPAEITKLTEKLNKNDRIVLCSDGLYAYISDEEMEAALNEMTLHQISQHWVKQVLRKGASDNFSFIILEPNTTP